MPVFQFEGVFGDIDDPLLRGLTAFVQIEVGGISHLAALGRNGLTLFRIGADGTLTLTDQIPLYAGFLPGALPGLASLVVDGSPCLGIAGQMPGGTTRISVTPEGVIESAPPEDWPANVALLAGLTLGGAAHVLIHDAFSRTLSLYADGAGVVATSAPGTIGPVAAIAVANIGDAAFAVLAEDGDTIAVLPLTGPSILGVADRMGAADGLGIAAVSQLATAAVAGETFVIVGAAGTSSISVLHLDGAGRLSFADHVTDGLGSRFQGLAALAVITAAGRSYVLAGGADDGVSAFLLLPGGRLFHLGAFEDTVAASLQNVSGLSAFVQDNGLFVLASGEVEGGVTQLRIDLSAVGATMIAPDGGGALGGSGLDDILIGGDASDTLSGGGGDDLIVDGAGADLLIGGPGADVFVFDADGATDRIGDFDPATDRIDLSRLPLLYDPRDVEIVTTATGAELRVRGELILLQSANGAPILAEDLGPAITINIDRPAFIPRVQTVSGTDGADTLVGGDGDDIIAAGGGDDLVDGGDGNDVLWGGSAGDPPGADWFAHRNGPLPDPDQIVQDDPFPV